MTRLAAVVLAALSCNAELDVLSPGVVTSAAACARADEPCGSAQDCCSEACRETAPGEGRCQTLAACAMASGQACVYQAGEACADDAACCTGACVASLDGVRRCAYLGGCHQQCEVCTDAASCCSGHCELDASGVGRCAPAVGTTCVADGEICRDGEDCCPASGGGTCGPLQAHDPASTDAPKRCHGPLGDLLVDGATCSVANACQGGFCVPNATGALVCDSVCRPEGGTCTTRADCCDDATHDCLAVAGVPTCVRAAQ